MSARLANRRERRNFEKLRRMADAPDAMREDYDFSRGVRGKYAARYAEGTNVVLLDPDVREVFPDSVSVNRALRALVQIIREQSNGT